MRSARRHHSPAPTTTCSYYEPLSTTIKGSVCGTRVRLNSLNVGETLDAFTKRCGVSEACLRRANPRFFEDPVSGAAAAWRAVGWHVVPVVLAVGRCSCS